MPRSEPSPRQWNMHAECNRLDMLWRQPHLDGSIRQSVDRRWNGSVETTHDSSCQRPRQPLRITQGKHRLPNPQAFGAAHLQMHVPLSRKLTRQSKQCVHSICSQLRGAC